jgi:histidine ammonia-lyase
MVRAISRKVDVDRPLAADIEEVAKAIEDGKFSGILR